MLKENVGEAIDLLRLALTRPNFDQVAVDRVRGQILSSLSSDKTDPDEIASATLRALSFPGHPYGTRDEGSLDALPEPVEMAIGGGTTIVDLATPQAVALFGHSGIAREDPQFFAAYLLNEVLGGNGVESRLMREVREKRGLTYGVYTFLAPFDFASQFMGSVASANDRIADAIGVIKDEWSLMAENGMSAQELEEAKLYVTGAYPLRFDSNAKIAGILVGLQLVGLPSDYIKTRNEQMMAVTLEEVNAMAKRLLKPEELRFVVVGQPEGLTPTE